VDVRDHHRFEVAAEGLGRYTIDVSLPAGHERSGARFPVILVTDGNILFDLVQVLVHGSFARLSTTLPPSIVVGVGYPTDEGNASWYGRRNFDFHGPWDMTNALGGIVRSVHGMMKNAEGKPELEIRAGGYDRFMRFLRDQLLPSLGARFPIDPEGRHTLVGDSSGGHFVLRALYDPTTPFRRYVCVSPTIGSAEGAVQQAEAAYAASHDDLDIDLFICCGTVEVSREPMTALCRFGSAVSWVAEQFAIRQWPKARVQWEVMNNEDHASIAPRGIAAGLRSVHRVRPGVHEAEIRQAAAAAAAALVEQRGTR
jgi:predicted alpha/beta superfamily hydrolase